MLNRWLALSAAMLMMSCAGLSYTYAVYSEQMKQRLHLSQEQIDDIGAAKELGSLVALLAGVFYSFYPAWVTIGVGTLLHFAGYVMFWLAVAGKISSSFWLLCVYSAVGSGGDGWVDTACMMTSLQNFEEHRGTALGILKSQLGLSAAMFVMVYEVLFAPDVNKFLLLITLLPTMAFSTLACFARPLPQTKDEPSPARRFRLALITIVILGLYLMFSVSLLTYVELTKLYHFFVLGTMVAIMILMYITPIIPLSPLNHPEEIELPKLHKKSSDIPEDELESKEEEHLLQNTDTSHSHIHIRTPLRCLRDTNFWLIFLVVTVGAGTGITIISNFAQIGEALGAGKTDIYVSLISIWSCYGRLGSGYVSDYLLRRGYPRPLCLLVTQITMAFCCLLLATGLVSSLFLGSALTGLSYGAYWTLVPAILSDVFGVQNFTLLYRLISLAPPIGSYVLSAKVVGYLYDQEAVLHHASNSKDEDACYGRWCFGFGLLALSLISMLGACASFFLFLGTKKFYQRKKTPS